MQENERFITEEPGHSTALMPDRELKSTVCPVISPDWATFVEMSDSAFLDSLRALAGVINEMLLKAPRLTEAGTFIRWERDAPGRAIGWAETSVYPLLTLDLTMTPEFQWCDEAMRNDPTIGPFVGHLVGYDWSSSVLDAPTAILRLLNESVVNEQVSVSVLEDTVDRIQEFLQSETTERRSFIGLFGVMVVDGPVELSGGVCLRVVEPSDLDLLIRTGVGNQRKPVVPAAMGRARIVEGLPDVVAEIRFPIPVREAGDTSPPDVEAAVLPDLHSIGDRVVTALALFTAARVARTGVISEDLHWFESGMNWSAHPQMAATSDAVAQLSVSDVERLAEFYRQLASEGVNNHAHLELSLHRFVMALSREREDDRLIDLSIAAEALLLKKGTALSLRLALRAAALADSTSLSPRKVFDRMQNAYKVRSNVVHGADVADDTIKTARIDLESDLRVLLAAYVQKASKTKGDDRVTLDEAVYLPDTDV